MIIDGLLDWLVVAFMPTYGLGSRLHAFLWFGVVLLYLINLSGVMILALALGMRMVKEARFVPSVAVTPYAFNDLASPLNSENEKI